MPEDLEHLVRQPWVFLILSSIAALGGCLQADDAGDEAGRGDVKPYDDGRAVAHHAGQMPAPWDGPVPTFEKREVAGQPAGEPTVAVLSDGTVFYVTLTPPLPSPHVWRTSDLGLTWTEVTPEVAPLVLYPPTTNDPFITSDPLTDRVFDLEMGYSADCSIVQWSDDAGESWSRSETDQCVLSRETHDHPSLTTGVPRTVETEGYPNAVYYCINRGEALCYRSLDGAATWQGPWATGLDHCGGLTGHVVTSPDGIVYLGQMECGSDARTAWIGISEDDGESWQTLDVLDGTVEIQGDMPATNAHEASIAVDAVGNVYYFFLDAASMPRLVVSQDKGRTWGPALDVSVPGLTGANFPSITAGDAGRIAVQYIGTTDPGGHDAGAETTWNAFVGMSLDATAETPTYITAQVNDPNDPLRRGPCSGRCMTESNIPYGMYDFLDISTDPQTGRVWTAIVDLCDDACATGSEEAQESRGAVGVQTGGPTLRVARTV